MAAFVWGPGQQEHCKSGPKHCVTQLCHRHQRGEGEKIHAGKSYPSLPSVSCVPGEVLRDSGKPSSLRKAKGSQRHPQATLLWGYGQGLPMLGSPQLCAEKGRRNGLVLLLGEFWREGQAGVSQAMWEVRPAPAGSWDASERLSSPKWEVAGAGPPP